MTGFELRTSGIKATALPTEPQPLPLVIVLIRNGGSKWPILKHAKKDFRGRASRWPYSVDRVPRGFFS